MRCIVLSVCVWGTKWVLCVLRTAFYLAARRSHTHAHTLTHLVLWLCGRWLQIDARPAWRSIHCLMIGRLWVCDLWCVALWRTLHFATGTSGMVGGPAGQKYMHTHRYTDNNTRVVVRYTHSHTHTQLLLIELYCLGFGVWRGWHCASSSSSSSSLLGFQRKNTTASSAHILPSPAAKASLHLFILPWRFSVYVAVVANDLDWRYIYMCEHFVNEYGAKRVRFQPLRGE